MAQLERVQELVTDDIVESLQAIAVNHPGKVVFSSSLGVEDQVITHIIRKNEIPIRIFTLDTGRLFEESYKTLMMTNHYYDTSIEVYFPNQDRVERLVNEKGPFSFYESVENRKECCFIRKVEPLKRALAGNEVWVTGIRSAQSDNRNDMPKVEFDEGNNIVKYHPILDWTEDDAWQFIRDNNIPYNSLHDKGFPSIGCASCTRAVEPGQDFRAGRWWWEDKSKKECGLHE